MASSNFIQEAIFKAVDVILEKRLKSLQVNYCILGIIKGERQTDQDTGETYYYVNYQDMLIKAYPVVQPVTSDLESTLTVHEGDKIFDILKMSENSTMMYKDGDAVYTLVINGDLSKKRLILCKA